MAETVWPLLCQSSDTLWSVDILGMRVMQLSAFMHGFVHAAPVYHVDKGGRMSWQRPCALALKRQQGSRLEFLALD